MEDKSNMEENMDTEDLVLPSSPLDHNYEKDKATGSTSNIKEEKHLETLEDKINHVKTVKETRNENPEVCSECGLEFGNKRILHIHKS